MHATSGTYDTTSSAQVYRVSMARDGARRTASTTVSATRCPGCTDYRRRAARWGTQSHGGERAPCESDLSFNLSFSPFLFVLSLSLCRVTHTHVHKEIDTAGTIESSTHHAGSCTQRQQPSQAAITPATLQRPLLLVPRRRS